MSAHGTMRHFENFGTVRSVRGAVRYPTGPDGRVEGEGSPTGHAWVRFEDGAAAAEALVKANGSLVSDRYLQMWRADSRAARQATRKRQHAEEQQAMQRGRRQALQRARLAGPFERDPRGADPRGQRPPQFRGAARDGRRAPRVIEGSGRVFVRGIPAGVRTPELIDSFLECGDVVRVFWPRVAPDAREPLPAPPSSNPAHRPSSNPEHR